MADDQNAGTPPDATDSSHQEPHEGDKVSKKTGKTAPKRTDLAAAAPRVDTGSKHNDKSQGDSPVVRKDTAPASVEPRAAPPEEKTEEKPKAEAASAETKPQGLVSRLRFERRVGKRRL